MNRIASHHALSILIALLVGAVSLYIWFPSTPGMTPTPTDTTLASAGWNPGPIVPVPQPAVASPAKAALGERLFHDPVLSSDRTVSCATCHDLANGGDDGHKFSSGAGGAQGTHNAPTVFNAALNFRQFWDGRAANLTAQVSGPIHNPVEMNSSWQQIIERLRAIPEYRLAFAENYPEGITQSSITDAIVTFEASVLTPDAPFDRFLKGDEDAIGPDALEGYRRFTQFGCASCHQGVNVGGNLYQRFGILGDYFEDRGHRTQADLGRFNVTGNELDKQVFKVPGLRNVALTAPYFHDGSIETLDEAVAIMGRYQLGRTLDTEDRCLIVAFLNTLTGHYRGASLQ